MKKILFLILLLIPIARAEIIITEIMSNPLADESLNEFIEVYNNSTEPVDMKGWALGDDKDNDTLEGGLYDKEGTIIPAQGYAIITDYTTRVYDNFNISSETIKLYVNDDSIGNGLRNEGEKVWLYKENELVQEIEYQSTGEGKTWAYSNDAWLESEPTPGYGDVIKDEDIKTGCDWKTEIITNRTFIEEPEFKIRIEKIFGDKNNLTLNRKIKNVFGETVKEYEPLEVEDALNYRTFDYSPNLKTGSAYTIEAEISSECDTNPENDKAEELIFVQAEKPKEESELEITQTYDLGSDKEAAWGQTIKIRLRAYKGNTGKKAIDLWAEDNNNEKASKQTSVNIEEKYSTTELTIPIQLKPNCDKKLKNGEYKIIAEGLDTTTIKKIVISGENKETCKVIKEVIEKNITKKVESCESVTEQNKNITVKTEKTQENKTLLNIENTTRVTGSVIYESKDQKAKSTGIYFYAGALALITIASILRK
jgi:hypothetical protein